MVPETKLTLKFSLQGWAANSSRRSEGFAFVAQNPAQARDRMESFVKNIPRILICPLLDWSWSDIANKVAGVVTDHGTRVSRGSEVSGIVQVAAVLGTRRATADIIDGDYVKIICEGNDAKAKIYTINSE
jgi:phosphohistidine swiveling domain-containing protein